MHCYGIGKTLSAILDQVGTLCKRPFGVTLSPKCSYRAPISQHRGPWDSPRKNPGENTAIFIFSLFSDPGKLILSFLYN